MCHYVHCDNEGAVVVFQLDTWKLIQDTYLLAVGCVFVIGEAVSISPKKIRVLWRKLRDARHHRTEAVRY